MKNLCAVWNHVCQQALIDKSEANLAVMANMVEKYDWIDFLAQDPVECYLVYNTWKPVLRLAA